MKYGISRMVPRKVRGRKTEIRLPGIHYRLSTEIAYLLFLRRILAVARRYVNGTILPEYRRELAVIFDAEPASSSMRQFLNAIVSEVLGRINQLLRVAAAHHTKQFMGMAKEALGVDLSGIVSEEDLTEYLDLVSQRNATLIKGMTDDLVKNVQTAVLNSVIQGNSHAKLKGELVDILRVSDNRAKLIARDQTAKLNSDLTRRRHRDAGIDDYIWRTAEDERVRARHRPLDGQRYSYGEPTGAEDGLPPGQPIQCRCVALGVVVFD